MGERREGGRAERKSGEKWAGEEEGEGQRLGRRVGAESRGGVIALMWLRD